MSTRPMPPLNQPAHLTEHDIRYLLDRMHENPLRLVIWGHQPLTTRHLAGYITTLEEHDYLPGITQVSISHAEFDGSLLRHLVRFTAIKGLELGVNLIHGPIDLRDVPVETLDQVDNTIDLGADRGRRPCIRPSAQLRLINWYGRTTRWAEALRLKKNHPALRVRRMFR